MSVVDMFSEAELAAAAITSVLSLTQETDIGNIADKSSTDMSGE